MILDDLFEQKPLPAHIKPSDLPPGMRSRLTMRDVEQERPRGAYRYRVIPGTPGESPKDFLDLAGAEQYAQAVRGRVQPLEEQINDPDVRRGMENVVAIEKTRKIRTPAIIDVGGQRFSISDPKDKEWFIKYIMGYINTGQADRIYKLMGNPQGFESILDKFAESHQAAIPDPDEDDLWKSGQAGGPKSPRYADESADQKKTSDLTEEPKGASARTQRMMTQMRARQPQATSDLEALAYELQDAERRDSEEISKLEREVDSLETDIKSELQKRIATLTRRRGGVQQAAAQDTKIDDTLDQLARANDQQQREINDLVRAVAGLGQRSAGVGIAAQPQTQQPPAAPAEPTTSAALGRTAQDLTRPTGVSTSSTGGTTMTTPTGVMHRAAPKPIGEPKNVDQSEPVAEPGTDTGTAQDELFGNGDRKVVDISRFRKAAESALEEKKKPQPTNPDLWSRAKSAARSKFDVYPSAYANAWAAKWYKSKGGGWRMGKPKKK
jgi:hypothetical protein